MALTDENGGIGTTMLVGPTGYGNGGNFANGFGGDWAWIILLLLAFGGGWGNGFGGGVDGGLYPWLNNSQNINGGFRDQMLNSSINGLQNSITSGFGDIQTALCGGFGSVNAGIANAAAQAEISANARQMATMNQVNGLQSQLAQCCCDNRLATVQTQNVVQTENAATRSTIQNGVQAVLDKLCQQEIEQKNDTIAQLRSELMYARGQASQDVQTAAIQAGQRALANEVEQYVLPTPRPAYVVANPNCCYNPCGVNCGCGA